VTSGGRVKTPAPPKTLQLQNRFTTIKAEGESDVATGKRPGSLNLKSCRTPNNKWQCVTPCCREQRHPSVNLTKHLDRLLLVPGQNPGCCGGTAKAHLAL